MELLTHIASDSVSPRSVRYIPLRMNPSQKIYRKHKGGYDYYGIFDEKIWLQATENIFQD